jgi:glycosyltransferase involved in cell wall biosynthesis
MITGIVLVKNQEKLLPQCLQSLSFCDEILVIDDESSDNSAKVAERMGARVYKRKLNNDFAKQRNWAMEKAKNEWVLFVDADEVVSPELATELYQLTSQFLTELNGFYLKRVDYMWGRKVRFGDAGQVKLLRLAKKTKGQWSGKVHEIWSLVGEVGNLKNPLIHYPHPTIFEFLNEVNFYSTLRAEELFEKNVSVSSLTITAYPIGKFIYLYFIKLGFLDGIPGIISALMMSFHSFLVRGKLWQLKYKKRTYEFGN